MTEDNYKRHTVAIYYMVPVDIA